MGAAVTFVRRDVLAEPSPKPSSRGPKRVATEPVRGGWSDDATRGRGRGAAGLAAGVVLAAVLLAAGACSGGSGSSTSSASSGSARVAVSAEPSDSSGPPSDPAGSGGATPSLSVSVSVPASLTPAEAKAAASAVDAYRQYVQVFNQVQQDGGMNVAPLSSVATYTALDDSKYEAALLAKSKAHQVGRVVIARASVSSVNLSPRAGKHEVPEIVLSSCEDASEAEFIDLSGKSIRKVGVPRFWETRIWVRFYPGTEAGVDGWVVARLENHGASSC